VNSFQDDLLQTVSDRHHRHTVNAVPRRAQYLTDKGKIHCGPKNFSFLLQSLTA